MLLVWRWSRSHHHPDHEHRYVHEHRDVHPVDVIEHDQVHGHALRGLRPPHRRPHWRRRVARQRRAHLDLRGLRQLRSLRLLRGAVRELRQDCQRGMLRMRWWRQHAEHQHPDGDDHDRLRGSGPERSGGVLVRLQRDFLRLHFLRPRLDLQLRRRPVCKFRVLGRDGLLRVRGRNWPDGHEHHADRHAHHDTQRDVYGFQHPDDRHHDVQHHADILGTGGFPDCDGVDPDGVDCDGVDCDDCNRDPVCNVGSWYDLLGEAYDCEWYADNFEHCGEFALAGLNFNMTANDACCACGGGVGYPPTTTHTATTTTVTTHTATTTTVCVDWQPTYLDPWEDVDGNGCTYYERIFSTLGGCLGPAGFGRVATEVCCACGGGTGLTATNTTATSTSTTSSTATASSTTSMASTTASSTATSSTDTSFSSTGVTSSLTTSTETSSSRTSISGTASSTTSISRTSVSSTSASSTSATSTSASSSTTVTTSTQSLTVTSQTASSTLSTATPCMDYVPAVDGYDSDVWYNSQGALFDCNFYVTYKLCSTPDDFLNFGRTHFEACCECGGGMNIKSTSVTGTTVSTFSLTDTSRTASTLTAITITTSTTTSVSFTSATSTATDTTSTATTSTVTSISSETVTYTSSMTSTQTTATQTTVTSTATDTASTVTTSTETTPFLRRSLTLRRPPPRRPPPRRRPTRRPPTRRLP
ncbi:unnamed protein product [Prorocentrum cordatum]|uniref:Cellulase n=1 Tax=Prorocentrum cordatum TaxID=2364126 RepID=A0ABN9V5H7_9DINO|nr:unnamed protein product [Polarella glacialis]